MSGTKIYGCSDDLIEFEGDVSGEVNFYYPSGDDEPSRICLVTFDDGTVLAVSYGKAGKAIWRIDIVRAGGLIDRIEICTDEDATPYSDIVFFKPGLKKAWAAKEWENVK